MQVRAKVQAFISSKKVNQGVIFVGGWPCTHADLGHCELFWANFVGFRPRSTLLVPQIRPKESHNLALGMGAVRFRPFRFVYFWEACWSARKQRRNFDG